MTQAQSPLLGSFPEPRIPFYRSAEFPRYFGAICFAICFIVLSTYRGGKVFFTRFFSVPPSKYEESIRTAYNGNGLIKEAKVGIKGASFRRRLILASIKPQQYSTVPLVTNDKTDCTDKVHKQIRIARVDKEENPEFLNLIKPMEPNFPNRKILYGFFHPYSYAGGGGERVLWEAVYVTLKQDVRNVAIIYTFTESNDRSVSSLLSGVHRTFGIDFFEKDIQDRVVFMQLPNRFRWIVDGSSFKFLTMAFQALGSFILFFLAMGECAPDIFIDTLGLPFAYPPASIFLQLPVLAYIHYPWVSSDMLKKIRTRMRSNPLLVLKFAYWYILMKLYSICGSFLDVSTCNSSWTLNNLLKVWTWVDDGTNRPSIVYPPTGIDESKIHTDPLVEREKVFLYVAQFRPEKRHELLIREFHKYLQGCKEVDSPYRLVLVGTTRSKEDEQTVEYLRKLVKELEIPEGSVIIQVNATREQIDKYLREADFGLNTMWNEHFGITVVEYMLYGVIPIVHASGGPLLDIVVPIHPDTHTLFTKEEREGSTKKVEDIYQSGFFFKDPSDPDFGSSPIKYDTLSTVLGRVTKLTQKQKLSYRQNAMSVADKKFGNRVFHNAWAELTSQLADYELRKRKKRDTVEKLY
ncbi:DEKNAAC100701 [Brettanomyces naardenensis]|uniref:GDP-Man:Man(3)GlcNAc(2)-PP-Dol alpha-1,2-mannosyltransferase n=1 Tax=Brettanomyces naardenensis TaxID=13370 RepID=A0A448YFW8_BRENA|nr:DEKNAAC100701 [Brettanomyces naardenensis]